MQWQKNNKIESKKKNRIRKSDLKTTKKIDCSSRFWHNFRTTAQGILPGKNQLCENINCIAFKLKLECCGERGFLMVCNNWFVSTASNDGVINMIKFRSRAPMVLIDWWVNIYNRSLSHAPIRYSSAGRQSNCISYSYIYLEGRVMGDSIEFKKLVVRSRIVWVESCNWGSQIRLTHCSWLLEKSFKPTKLKRV
jgi:hypothetical protein